MINFNVKQFLLRVPYVKALWEHRNNYTKNACFPPGHFYSPIVSVNDIRQKEDRIWSGISKNGVPGIDLNAAAQRELVTAFAAYYEELPFSEEEQEDLRYYFDNGFYSYTDGIVLYAMMRHLEPKRIIEIGSGFSSALMLDVNERFFDHAIQLSFIEPYPDRLQSLLRERDQPQAEILVKDVQEIPLDYFRKLEAGDILFVDSTHVSKTGSDVNYILFDILPVLKSGVYIHFHDIFYPFEYPKAWVYGGRNWNENYLLRAFLMHNDCYRIRLFAHYLHVHHKAVFTALPLTYRNYGGNLWVEKQ